MAPILRRRKQSKVARLFARLRANGLFALLAATGVVSLAVVAAVHQRPLDQGVSFDALTASNAMYLDDTSAADAAPRRNYPYSIVAGGVQSPDEVARAMADDAVVATHYAGLDPTRLRVAQASATTRAYVSYRRGNRVYWTSHPVSLHVGEMILTDGVTTLRARCGNMLSDVPRQPVAHDEPSDAALERFDNVRPTAMLDTVMKQAGWPRLPGTLSLGAAPIAGADADPGDGHLAVPVLFAPRLPAIGWIDPTGDERSAVDDPVAQSPDASGPIFPALPADPDPDSPFGPGFNPFPDPGNDPGSRNELDPGSPPLGGDSRAPQPDPGLNPGPDPGPEPGPESGPLPVPEPGTIVLVGIGLATGLRRAFTVRARAASSARR